MRVVIAEDSVLLREGTVRLLEEAGVEVVGRAGDAEELMRTVRAERPDVAIVDIRMPPGYGTEGLRAAAEIRRELPATGVMILSQYLEEHFISELMAGGTEGVGYLLKDRVADVELFVDAVRRVADGGSVLDPQVVAELLGRRRPSGPLDTLTDRERAVLAAMAEGLTNREIAGRMFLSERAVERHVTAIFGKLGLALADGGHRRVLAVRAFLDL